MRITSLNIKAGRIGGLKSIEVHKLGKIVVLAGKNGAGKSRLLSFLGGWLTSNFPSNHGQALGQIGGTVQQLRTKLAHPEGEKWNDFAQSLPHAAVLMPIWGNFLKKEREDNWHRLTEVLIEGSGEPQIISFLPKRTRLADPSHLSPHELRQNAAKAESGTGVSDMASHATAAIQNIQNRWWAATHQNSQVEDAAKEQAIKNYSNLQVVLQRFLGVKLDRGLDDNATLFGLPLGEAKLSDGQSVILQFCVAIHAQAHRLSDLIILMDEPENHLHPAAMLDVINEIQSCLANGQLWIATHSIPLLANFDPDDIWWMDESTLSHAGSAPEKVLTGLLGDGERLERLNDFIGLPAAFGLNRFTSYCLLKPEVVLTGPEDVQLRQIRSQLWNLGSEKLRVLDFGAGKGRLISGVVSEAGAIGPGVDYIAFDVTNDFEAECKACLERAYPGDSKERWFGDEGKLRTATDAGSVDVIVMCNVLHEIDPRDWLALFKAAGLIRHCLNEGGYLLVVEDTEMRVGEIAHERGFLVLDTPDLKLLFNIDSKVEGFVSNDARQDGRLKATLIPAKCLQNISAETLKKTLEQVAHLAGQKIAGIRKDPEKGNYRTGRKLAFYLQQFANAKLCLEG